MEPITSESPPSRTTILGSFLRGRPRNSSQSHIHVNTDSHPQPRELSPSPPSPNTISHRRRTMAGGSGPVQQSTSAQPASNGGTTGLTITNMLRRRRSAGNVAAAAAAAAALPAVAAPSSTGVIPALPSRPAAPSSNPSTTNPATSTSAPTTGTPAPSGTTHRIRLVPHLDSRRSLRFDAVARELKESDSPLRIGRFTDRSGLGIAVIQPLGSNKLAFRSKVVSRAHAELWVESGGRFFIRDTKSSSGTFLNHVRLSPANTESRPHQVKDGDILQLGVDYQGGVEDLYKSVKIRVELGREWQASANAFNMAALKNLKALAAPLMPSKSEKGHPKPSIQDCCICLFPVSIHQALFIAPCSHSFHYKCIRPLLGVAHPQFTCPVCRAYADLDEDVEVEGVRVWGEDESSAEEGDLAAVSTGAEGNGEPDPARENDTPPPVDTEVESDFPSRLRPPPQHRGSPFTDELLEEEEAAFVQRGGPEEAYHDNVGVAGASSRLGAGAGEDDPMDVDEDGMVGEGEDVDGTVGGKRKR